MNKGRLEAFSDGVIAILITIMVLDLRTPAGRDFASLAPMGHVFVSYVLSFLYLAIYWTNHHHLLQAAQKVNGAVLWANLHLLFWLSLFPFATAWLGDSAFAPNPTAFYGLILLAASLAFVILTRILIAQHGKDSVLARSIGRDVKGLASVALYATAIGVALVQPLAAGLIYALVALMWLIPDRRIERMMGGGAG